MSTAPAPAVPRRSLLAAGFALWPALLTSARPVRPALRSCDPAVAAAPAARDAGGPSNDASPGPSPARPVVPRPFPTGSGVNLAGAEFGHERADFSNQNPGEPDQDYLYPSPGSVREVAGAGVGWVRLPVRWERLQPAPGGPLNAGEFARLDATLDRLRAAGLAAIVDVHNYARYTLDTPAGPREVLIDEVIEDDRGRSVVPVSREDFAQFWTLLAGSLAGRPAVAGWGLMNEPHDLRGGGRRFACGSGCDWIAVSRLAADAVRRADPGSTVVVGGADWSSSERWLAANGPEPWIDGPNVVYEAHCYLDSDAAGKYRVSYQEEAAADRRIGDRAAARLEPFLEWCARGGVNGLLGECGVPPADDGWGGLWGSLLGELKDAKTPGCLWAAGEWWGNYPLNVHPHGGVAGPVLNAALTAA